MRNFLTLKFEKQPLVLILLKNFFVHLKSMVSTLKNRVVRGLMDVHL